MAHIVIDIHRGVQFRVETRPRGQLFEGRFAVLDAAGTIPEANDPCRFKAKPACATEPEALRQATEAAHRVIEGLPPFANPARDTP